jgi:ParB family chromosome partitioning protein|tara:strand:+ start:19272 stop:20168 length:897 start_codon:yes stop_codon:yes gene_type:complete
LGDKLKMAKEKKKSLGKGLAALIGDLGEAEMRDLNSSEIKTEGAKIPIEYLEPNRNQPRKTFDEDSINELAQSIKEKGILLPILVRPLEEKKYQIIAGERRWRAAQKANLHEIPVVIKDLEENEVLEIALIENIQREDLTAIEEASGLNKLLVEHNYTQKDLSKIIGKSRSNIANTLRLLSLPHKVQDFVQRKILTAGHARSLVGLENALSIAQFAIKKKMSVRQLEQYVNYVKNRKNIKSSSGNTKKDPNALAIEKSLSDHLGLTVTIKQKKGEQGELKVVYKNFEQLDYIIKRLNK